MSTPKSKIKKKEAPIHIVIPDTNILWHQDKSYVADPDFDNFWESNKSLLPMELAIPEVVIGELNFQQATSATKQFVKISEALKDLSAIVAAPHKTKLTQQEIKVQVEGKINRWLKSKSATSLATPINPARWLQLIQSAIWRQPPFTYDPKNPDVEKGFRDALILETVVEAANQALAAGKNIVFLCKDQLLRTTAVEALEKNNNALCFESLKDFEGYIKLTQEQLTSSFVTAIQNRARQRFFSKSDPKCFYTSKDVNAQIIQKFGDQLQPPHSSNSLRTGLLSLGEVKWELVLAKNWIGSTTFEKLVQPRRYWWTTKVTLSRLFREYSVSDSGVRIELQNECILLLMVDVKWSADVKADGRFLDADINQIDLQQNSVEAATPELLKRWGLASGSVN